MMADSRVWEAARHEHPLTPLPRKGGLSQTLPTTRVVSMTNQEKIIAAADAYAAAEFEYGNVCANGSSEQEDAELERVRALRVAFLAVVAEVF